jgi:citronellol/citronellal dehydrogenase
MSLAGKTLFITGASRGIGLAIALRAAKDGANIVVAAKTAEPHPKLRGTIFTAAEEIEAAGGKALPLVVDVREEDAVEGAVAKAVETFGGIDILVNNASAISLSGTLSTPMKRYDLMHSINTRGTYVTSQKALPALLKAANPHVLNISPPLNMDPKWFKNHVAYTIEMIGGDAAMQRSRIPDIMADAAHAILQRPAKETTGNFFIDDEVLAAEGITDLRRYAVNPDLEPMPDFFL